MLTGLIYNPIWLSQYWMLQLYFEFRKLDDKCLFGRVSTERYGCLQGLYDLLYLVNWPNRTVCRFQYTMSPCMPLSASSLPLSHKSTLCPLVKQNKIKKKLKCWNAGLHYLIFNYLVFKIEVLSSEWIKYFMDINWPSQTEFGPNLNFES